MTTSQTLLAETLRDLERADALNELRGMIASVAVADAMDRDPVLNNSRAREDRAATKGF